DTLSKIWTWLTIHIDLIHKVHAKILLSTITTTSSTTYQMSGSKSLYTIGNRLLSSAVRSNISQSSIRTMNTAMNRTSSITNNTNNATEFGKASEVIVSNEIYMITPNSSVSWYAGVGEYPQNHPKNRHTFFWNRWNAGVRFADFSSSTSSSASSSACAAGG